MQHPDETPANIRLKKQMKHSEHTLETYMYSHCNMCNILIYFCNIKMKHLKHLKHTFATWAFNAMSSCYLDEWRLVVVELDGGTWSSSCASDAGNSPTGRLHTKLNPPPRLFAGASVVEACRLGGGGRGSPNRWRRPRRAGSVVERGRGEHGRAVEVDACDRAAW
jgi:hypothetical protein